MLSFFINLNLSKIEASANDCGFLGPTWKQDVLADLLHDGRLRIEKAHDPRDPSRRVWHCIGQRASLACVPDTHSLDTLFCIGLVAGPKAGGPRSRGKLFEVPGPWGIHTIERRPRPLMSVDEHIHRCSPEYAAPSQLGPLRHVSVVTTKASSRHMRTRNAVGLQSPLSPVAGVSPASRPEDQPIVSLSETVPVVESEAGVMAEGIKQEPEIPVASVVPEAGSTLGAKRYVAWGSRETAPLLRSKPDGIADAHKIAFTEAASTESHAGVSPPEASDQDAIPKPGTVSAANVATAGFATARLTSWDAVELQHFQETRSWESLALAAVVRADPALDGILQSAVPIDARRQRIARLEAEIARLSAELADVPGDERIIEGDELRHRISALGAHVAPNPPLHVRVYGPAALENLLGALGDEAIRNLPGWALGFEIDDQAERVKVLSTPDLQTRVLAALKWVRQHFAGAPPDRLRTVPEPDVGGPVEDRLEAAWKTEETLAATVGTLPPSCISLLRTLPSAQVTDAVSKLTRWFTALDAAAFDGLVESVAADVRSGLALLDPQSLDDISGDDREILKDLRTIEKARRFLDRAQSSSRPRASITSQTQSSTPQSIAKVVDLDHVLTDDRGKIVAAPIVVPPVDPGVTFVLLEFPIRIVADGVTTKDITITVTSSALTAVSRDALLPSSVQIRPSPNSSAKVELHWRLSGDEKRWRPTDSGRFSREEVLPFPVTLGEANKLRERKTSRISLGMMVHDAKATLHFENFLKQMPELASGTGVGMASATDLVRSRPLGVQIQHEKLQRVLEEGRLSFMVVAPRRFGKTTLFLHLSQHARTAGHLVVSISLERDLTPDQGVQMVWDGLRREFSERFGSAPALGETRPRTLTDEAAWTAVRRFTREKTGASLVVLIDEAQALVPRYGGQRWGHQLKNFIDRFLFEPSDKLAAVQLVLFGTVDLSVRIGQNCRDFLLMHGTEQYVFDESSLARYLRTVGQGAILSSKAARLDLALWTSNLRTLKLVFDLVHKRISAHQHAFMLDVDVLDVIEGILKSGGHLAEEIWTYARAELSHRDEWEPVDAFPLAVAWARPALAKLNQPERLEDCVQWLSTELSASVATGSVPAERVEAGLRDLKTRGVLRDNGEFYRPLMRELLATRSNVLRQDRDSQLALLRLAVDDVEWPDLGEPREEGGQARIFVQTQGERTLAYRACKLDSDENRRRFARTCAAIRTLRDRRTKLPGDDHLPRVIKAGFRVDNASEGVIVYEWVDGECVESLWSKLPEQGRAHVVRQIAMAVGALHARDVIHCDIAPRNIIVNGRLDATLIDFGLARRTDQLTQTRLAPDPFKAPEQCEEPPSAVKASDVYALAILLRGPNPKADLKSPGLRELAAKMSSARAEDRPSIVEVNRRLDDLVEFEPMFHQLRSKVEDVVAEAPEWLWEELLQFTGSAALVSGGYIPWDTQRAMEVSFLLNNLFVKIIASRRGNAASKLAAIGAGTEISLAAVRGKVRESGDKQLKDWECAEVKAVGLLRIAYSHPKDRPGRLAEATRELRSRETSFQSDARNAVVKVASMLDELSQAGGGTAILRFTQLFLGGP